MKNFLFLVSTFLFFRVGFGQVTTIDFETSGSGYTPSTTFGSGFTDVFNRANPTIGGNSTFIWAVEDISGDPSITLDQIDVTGGTDFTFSIDMLAHHFEDWDADDELLITYSLDGGAFQNLMWIQMVPGDNFNGPAALDLGFDNNGDCGVSTTLPALTTGTQHGCTVSSSNFATFSSPTISLSANSTLDIVLQFNGLTSGDEGIYLDNIEIDVTQTAAGCNITSINLANIQCSDNGTNANSSDDIITFQLDPAGSSLGTNYNVAVTSGTVSPTTAAYGSATTFTMQTGSAGGGDFTVTITDDTDGTCTASTIVTDPGSCSIPPCTEPSQATALVLDNETSSSIDVSFTGSGADNYLVVQSTSSTLSSNPTDATTFAVSDALGGGTVVYNGSGTSFTASSLSPSTQYYYFVFAYNDDACSGGPNYEIPALSGDATTLVGPTCFAVQDFDGTNTWTYSSDVSFFDNGFDSDGFYGINPIASSSPLANVNFSGNILAENDLDDEGNGTTGFATTTFASINVSSYNDVVISFDYDIEGYNANNDDAKYEIFHDGVGQGEVFILDGNGGPEDATGSISESVPNSVGQVSLAVSIRNNGGSGYSGFDNFSVCGVLASPEPEINVQGNATDIPDGNTAISLGDNTDFGDVLVSSGSNANTFTIQNVGTADLNLTSVVSSNATEFAVSGTTSGSITAGNSATFTVTFDPTATGTRTATITIESDDDDEATYTFDVAGTGTAIPDIVLSSANPAVAASDIVEGSDNNLIYAFQLDVSNFDAELTAINVTTSGTYAAGNITNFKAWYSADATFSTSVDVVLELFNNSDGSLGTGPHLFTGFSQTIANGSTGYIFITTNLPCPSTDGNTLIVDAITTADLTFVSGNKTGTAFASETHTIIDDTPTNISGLTTANCENGGVDLSWTDATGCFDNYLVVASLSSLVTAPTGDGIAYDADANFGDGTPYDDGFVVYEDDGTSVSITGLTNGTNYTYTVFTRNGENWSSGVEVDCTPNLVYCNAGPTSSNDSEIENVELVGENNSISNNTTDVCTGTAGGFVNDFTAQSADLGQGDSYTLTVEFGDCDGGGQFDGAGGVWIDWNGDGDFDDIDEEIGTLDVAVSGGNVTENFTINVAISQPVGNYRMRIVQEEGGDAASISPCGTYSWGSVEDYTVEVIIPCTPTHTFTSMLPTSGPEGTEITISGTGFTSSTTASFGSTPANVSFIDATSLIVEVPSGASTGAITLLEAACPIQTSIFTIIEESGLCVGGTGAFTDIFISEVFDGDFGNTLIVELFNPTSSPINLTGYTIELYSNGSATSSRTIALTGSIASNSTYLASLGTTSDPCSLTYDYNVGGSGINGDDDLRLFNGATEIDEWLGQFGGITGYSSIRKGSATAPSIVYDNADWDFFSTESCSNLGTGPVAVYDNPIVSPITDASDCDIISYSISVTEGDLSTTDDVTYQWYFNDGVNDSWTAVNSANLIGYAILGEDTNNLTIEGDTNPLSALDGYQFYCEVIEDGTCENTSNAEKFELQSGRFYRSTASGNWDNEANWEIADSLTGTWTAACVYPNETNSDYISIEANHSMTLNLDLNADQIIVQSDATLILDEKLTVANGNTSSEDLEVIGTLQDNGSLAAGIDFINGATWLLDADGTIIKTHNSSVNNYRDNYETGIANIPATADWAFVYDGSGPLTVSSVGMFYPNLSFESSAGNYDASGATEVFTGSTDIVTVKGDLSIGVGSITGGTDSYKLYTNNTNASPMLILGDVFIEAGSEFTNQDAFLGTTHGTGVEVNGSFLVDGSWNMVHGTGITLLSGTVKQNITSSGVGVFETYEFEIDNTSNTELDDIDVEITNTLTFTNGKIITDISTSDKVFVQNSATTAIVGGVAQSGNSNYVEGKLQWTTDGTSSYTFPVGDATHGAQGFSINLVAGGNNSEILGFLEANNTPPIQAFAYCDLETPNGGSGQIGSGIGTPDGTFDQIEFTIESPLQWDITNPGGGISEYDVTVLATGTQDISPIQSTNGATDIRYLLKNGQPGNPTVPTTLGAPSFNALGFEACPNQYSLSGLTSFSKFTLNGANASNTLLPVELLYFTAKANNNDVQIDWTTVTEINNDYFTLERSSDGVVFKVIAEVDGAGNSSEQINYKFIDKEPVTGNNYYRLKQTDFDGTISYSQIEAVYFGNSSNNEEIDYTIYPNPFDNIVNIVTNDDQEINVTIYDVTGKLVRNHTFIQETKLNVSELAKGAYVLKLVVNDNVKTLQLIKE